MSRRFGFRSLPLVLLLFKCLVGSRAHPQNPALDVHWYPATATWYGSPEGDGSNGGACGYGTLVNMKPMRARVTAVSPALYRNGTGCGSCFKVKCQDKSICARRAVTVIVTDECPSGGYSAIGRTHFDLSGAAFGHIAVSGEGGQLRNRGVLPIVYRRTPCKYHGKSVTFQVNEGSSDFWLSILVLFEDGDGDIGSVQIKQASSTEWEEMTHLWGANWCLNKGPLKGPFSVRVTTQTTGTTLSATNIIPSNWAPKATYTASRLKFLT